MRILCRIVFDDGQVMMKSKIEQWLKQALVAIYADTGVTQPEVGEITLERPRDPTHGDFSSNIAMTQAKALRMPPRVLAEKIIQALPSNLDDCLVSIAGPGFINFALSAAYFATQCNDMWASKSLGVKPVDQKLTVVVDYSSPNLAKEMHIGHLRSTIIGDALANIFAYKGYHVIRQNHVGDWGTQFGMLIAHLDEVLTHDTLALNDLESFYQAAKKRFDEDEAFAHKARQWVVALQSGDAHCLSLWKKFIELSLAHGQAVYDRLHVALKPADLRAESAYNDDLPLIIDALKQQGLLTQADGAQCVFLDGFVGKDQEPLPIIVQKKDGGFLYASTDLAALRYRDAVLHADRILYVVDARQALHFKQIFALAQRAGFVRPHVILEHVSFGMVLDRAGKPFKSRDGGVTKLNDLLDEAFVRAEQLIASKKTPLTPEQCHALAHTLGMAAVKYADLSKNRIHDYMFDWDTMLSFEGNTAPYMMYAYTRIKSLFSKSGVLAESLAPHPFVLADAGDVALAKQVVLYADVIDVVVEKATPHVLCTYLYELAGVFSSFYESCPILNQDQPPLKASRLKLADLTARILSEGLALLGIHVPERM